MAQCEPFEIEGEIRVLFHAVDQARLRDPQIPKDMVARLVRDSIVARVSRGVKAGLVYDERPKGFRLNNRGKVMPLLQRFVIDPDNNAVGWIVALDQPPDVVVVTTLVRLVNTDTRRSR